MNKSKNKCTFVLPTATILADVCSGLSSHAFGRTRGAYICTNCGNFNELVLGSGPTRKETMGPLISGNKTSPAITCEFRGMNSESNMYVQRLLEKSHEATVMFQIVHLTLIQFSAQMAR